jgi:ubiquinone biosynthesis protein
MNRLETLTNRLVLAVIAAAFIIGLAVLMSFYHPAGWQPWIAVVFALGFSAAAGVGLFLAWSIVRSSR